MIARHLRITGRVQRVGYRHWFLTRATSPGLIGWVRNRVDGSVEAVIQGPDTAVARMIAEAGDGPPLARVDLVLPVEQPADPILIRLEERPTC